MSGESKFKIYFEKEDKTTIMAGLFSKFGEFDRLKKGVVAGSQKEEFKQKKKSFTEGDNFVLEIFDAKGPIKDKINDIPPIYNINTYNYLLERLKSCSENGGSVLKLKVKKVDELPKWEKPQYEETLKKVLMDKFIDIKKSLAKEFTEHRFKEIKEEFDRKKYESNSELKEFLYRSININIVCENCFSSNFYGIRYICAECHNFNLCKDCYHQVINHQDHNIGHTFIQVKQPIFEDISKFNNIISPKYLFFDDKITSFEVKFTIINSGEMDLEGCYIVPIRYGNNYLGCLRKTITDSVESNDKIEVDLMIKFPEEEKEVTYEGYFRMFTEYGVPFGDVLFIKSLRKNF